MPTSPVYGYANGVLRVDMAQGKLSIETPNPSILRSFLGGAGFGAKLLYDEVPPGVEWSDPANRLILASGPLGGTAMPGSGTFCVVTKGALTGGAASTQANGFLGAFLRSSGFDAVVIHGKAEKLTYLYIHDGAAELRDAAFLAGKDTTETETLLKQEIGTEGRQVSVFSIGPAGENLVRYACIVGDKGHVAAHNGVGAVMGSKGLKAIVVARGRRSVPIKDKETFSAITKEHRERLLNKPEYRTGEIRNWGTLDVCCRATQGGTLVTRNYTTNVYNAHDFAQFSGPYIREHFHPRPTPCWACPMRHCHTLTIPDGPYAGRSVEEPEYEGLAAWSGQIGQTDLVEALMLSDLVDRLGMDTNEAGWSIGLAIECYEKGLLTRKETGGIALEWGNVDSVRAMLHNIAHRRGFGDILAEGAMRAATRLGREAASCAVHTKKGNTPRSHDHRLSWREMFDTCMSSTGTLESSWFIAAPNFTDLGFESAPDPHSTGEISTFVARTKTLLFEDSLGTCGFCTQTGIRMLAKAISAATGWDFTVEEAKLTGLRIANLLKAYNLRCGLGPELDGPSPRYGSTPIDGKSAGKGIGPVWEEMVRNYYTEMGWDNAGRPLPQTLQRLGLANIVKDIW
ncbi:MAG: aldehyde ferredoxin oxidoreductase family protein [Chloroflexi bacterium]|nr:aldehyde ferredoxin oxidoreductase family protein [Chloroflexota bacterium]